MRVESSERATSQRGGRAVSSPDYEQLPPLRLGVSPRGWTATAHRWFIWITPTGANPWVLCLGMFAFRDCGVDATGAERSAS